MATAHQLDLPFSLLDTQGKVVLSVREVAERLGCTTQHVANLIASGHLAALSIGQGQSRMAARIPVEAFRDFVIRSLTVPFDRSPLRTLPTQALIRMHREIGEHLARKGIRS